MKNKSYAAMAFLLSIAMVAFINKPKNKFRDISGEAIINWNLITHETMIGKDYECLNASRVYAMVHLAMHDALNAIDPVYESYAFKGRDKKADPVAAAVKAAHTVLAASFPDKKEMLNAKLNQWLSRVKPGDAKNRGIALGEQAGRTIYEVRKNDGSTNGKVQAPLAVSVRPGIYQLVPPFEFVYAPHWKSVRTFSLNKFDQFRCAPPPALNSSEYAEAFNEVKQYGGKKSTVRTPDQTFYAKFWYELSEIGWNRIGRVVATDKKLDIFTAARLFALLNMTVADAYIAGWDSKLHYNFWRPYTAIHFADTDDNPATQIDETWESQEVTPPIHDYPSTHSALGNAGASVLAGLLGDNTSFTFTSTSSDPQDATRSFISFSQAADENADSRVMAGLHFRFSCRAGQDLGNKIGQWTLQNHLKPLKR